MIKNYLKVAFRNLLKNKSYVLINTLGMGIAITCCMSAYLLVAYNIEFDNYLNKSDVKNIVKVLENSETADGYLDQNLAVPAVMPSIASEEISGIKQFVRYVSQGVYITNKDETFSENIHFADANLFDMFDLGLINGSTRSFQDVKTIFLSEELAEKYFRDEDPIGKQLIVEFGGIEHEVLVGAVMEKLPLNSTFIPKALMRIEPFLSTFKVSPNNWSEERYVSALFELTDIGQRKNVESLMEKYVSLRNEAKEDIKVNSFKLLNFSEPLSAEEAGQSYLHNRIPNIALIIFNILGFIILLIACFNLTNTTMALTGKRLKEIGVRKVVGSTRKQIVFQFLLEILITIMLAIVAGWLMAQVVVPEFAAMWGLMYGLSDLAGINLVLMSILILFVSALLAGIYPALFNSKFRPVFLLKGGLKLKGTNNLTRTLLVAQFSLSVIVLISGIVFTKNASFQNNIDFGYNKENLMTVVIQGEKDYNLLKNAIATNPKIESIAPTNNHFGPYTSYEKTFQIDTSKFTGSVYEISPEYFSTIGLEIVKGRNFLKDAAIDAESAIIVNENFADKYKLSNPIDTRVLHEGRPYRIVGLVKNHLNGLKTDANQDYIYQITPPDKYNLMVVRSKGDQVGVQKYIEEEWKKLFPRKPFESDFQQDILYKEANLYNQNLKKIFLFLTVLGCLLSISGIYSLATLNIQKRTKEIGVRKVLGASEGQIVKLVNKEFVIILSIAALLGGAGGFLLANKLLNDLYVQHINVGILTILIGGVIVFAVGVLTTSSTIFKASRANPTKTLKVQ